MPISDYLLSLALALHPAPDGKALALGAEVLIQPAGGVQVQLGAMDSASKDPQTFGKASNKKAKKKGRSTPPKSDPNTLTRHGVEAGTKAIKSPPEPTKGPK